MIERCQDYRRIKRFVPEVMVSHEAYYLVEHENGEDLGVWFLHPWEDGALLHADLGEKCRGRVARDSGLEMLRWVFENTGFRKVYAMTQVRAAQFMAVLIGMEFLYSRDGWRCYVVRA